MTEEGLVPIIDEDAWIQFTDDMRNRRFAHAAVALDVAIGWEKHNPRFWRRRVFRRLEQGRYPSDDAVEAMNLYMFGPQTELKSAASAAASDAVLDIFTCPVIDLPIPTWFKVPAGGINFAVVVEMLERMQAGRSDWPEHIMDAFAWGETGSSGFWNSDQCRDGFGSMATAACLRKMLHADGLEKRCGRTGIRDFNLQTEMEKAQALGFINHGPSAIQPLTGIAASSIVNAKIATTTCALSEDEADEAIQQVTGSRFRVPDPWSGMAEQRDQRICHLLGALTAAEETPPGAKTSALNAYSIANGYTGFPDLINKAFEWASASFPTGWRGESTFWFSLRTSIQTESQFVEFWKIHRIFILAYLRWLVYGRLFAGPQSDLVSDHYANVSASLKGLLTHNERMVRHHIGSAFVWNETSMGQWPNQVSPTILGTLADRPLLVTPAPFGTLPQLWVGLSNSYDRPGGVKVYPNEPSVNHLATTYLAWVLSKKPAA